jgi:hypothetical protein
VSTPSEAFLQRGSPDYPIPVALSVDGSPASADNPSSVNIAQVGSVAVDPTEPAKVTPAPFTTMTTGQVALSTSAAPIVAADATRRNITVVATVDWIYGFTSGVTASTGMRWYAGIPRDFGGYVGAIYGILADGTGTASYDTRTD